MLKDLTSLIQKASDGSRTAVDQLGEILIGPAKETAMDVLGSRGLASIENLASDVATMVVAAAAHNIVSKNTTTDSSSLWNYIRAAIIYQAGKFEERYRGPKYQITQANVGTISNKSSETLGWDDGFDIEPEPLPDEVFGKYLALITDKMGPNDSMTKCVALEISGHSQQEICKILDLDKSAVSRKLHRAKAIFQSKGNS